MIVLLLLYLVNRLTDFENLKLSFRLLIVYLITYLRPNLLHCFKGHF